MPSLFYKPSTTLRLSAIFRIAEKSLFVDNLSTAWIKPWDSTRSPPCCIMRPVAAVVNYVYTVKITQQFRRLGTEFIIIFPRATREPFHNNRRGPLT